MLAEVTRTLVKALREHVETVVGRQAAPDAPEYVRLADIAAGGPGDGDGPALERLVVSLIHVTPDVLVVNPLPAEPPGAAPAPVRVPLRASFLVSADYSDHELAIARIAQSAAGLSTLGVMTVEAPPTRHEVPDAPTARVVVTLEDVDVDTFSRLWLSLGARRRPALLAQVRVEE